MLVRCRLCHFVVCHRVCWLFAVLAVRLLCLFAVGFVIFCLPSSLLVLCLLVPVDLCCVDRTMPTSKWRGRSYRRARSRHYPSVRGGGVGSGDIPSSATNCLNHPAPLHGQWIQTAVQQQISALATSSSVLPLVSRPQFVPTPLPPPSSTVVTVRPYSEFFNVMCGCHLLGLKKIKSYVRSYA